MHTFGIIVAAWILIAAAIFAFQRFFAGRSGTRPSRDAVVHAIERLAAGDYTARLEGGKGLSGDLVKSFNRMAEVLDKRFGLMEEEIGRGQGKDAETVRLEEHSSKLEEELIRTNSDLLRKEVMLEEINQELILAARVKSEFISNMGRELKTPLNTIAGLSDFVLSGSLGTLGERQREIVTDIKESASDLLDVVDNILEFTLLEMGGAINCLDFPLKAVTEEVVSSITPLAESQKVALSVDMPDAVLCADPKKFRFILYDLLHNAIRFNRPGGRATLRGNFVGREGEPWFPGDDASRKTHLKVTVEDTGKGFESSLIEELYKPFSQVHLGGGKKMQGTVLSLSLIKKCVELHEGRFWAESKPGVGSRFSFTIPLDLQKQALIEWGKKKVLVVDDDPDYMRVVLAYFKEEPYEVLTARDGLDALRIVEEESPDLILMDVLMPKMDGIEVCKALKHEERFQRYRHIPVIIFTSLADLASKVKGIQAGADDFLVKPLDKDLLKERVKSLIEAKEQFEKMLASYRDLEKDSTHDPLTGLYNRRYMDEALVREFKNAARFNRHISLLMVDIDHFKNYNDTHGHQEGDHLLQGLAQVLKETVRDVDVVARFGGEEFVVILPETPSDMAMVAAERIRVGANSKTGITISIGVATYPEDSLEKDGLMEKADQALYEAKGSGRDRSVKYHAEESAPKAAASERDKDLPS